MPFDITRPCGTEASRRRLKNAYSRKELEGVAREYSIKKIKSKTMDELCSELRSLVLGKEKPEIGSLGSISGGKKRRMVMFVGPSAVDAYGNHLLAVGVDPNTLLDNAPESFAEGKYYEYSGAKEARKRVLESKGKDFKGNFLVVARPPSIFIPPTQRSHREGWVRGKDDLVISAAASEEEQKEFGESLGEIPEVYYVLDIETTYGDHSYVFDFSSPALLKYVKDVIAPYAFTAKGNLYASLSIWKIESTDETPPPALWVDAARTDVSILRGLRKGKATEAVTFAEVLEKVPGLLQKAPKGTLESKLGGPFEVLPPGTLEKLKGKLQKPVGGVLLVSGNHWKVLDKELHQLSSVDVPVLLTSVSMYPDGSKFVGITVTGVGVWDLEGKVSHTVFSGDNSSTASTRINYSIPMSEDTILYTRVAQFIEEIFLHKVSASSSTLLRTNAVPGGKTEGLFRVSDTQYLRVTGNHISIGSVETGNEEDTYTGDAAHNKVIQISPKKYFSFGSNFFVIEIGVKGVKVTRLKAEVKILGEAKRISCAAAVTENRVALMEKFGGTIYLLDLKKDELISVHPRTHELENIFVTYPFPSCAIASVNDLVFFNSNSYKDSLLVFDAKRVSKYRLGEVAKELKEGKEGTAKPSSGAKEVRGGYVDDKYVHGTKLTRTVASLQGFPTVVPITNINFLVGCQATSPEYVMAVNASVSLMAVPKELQRLTAKFLE